MYICAHIHIGSDLQGMVFTVRMWENNQIIMYESKDVRKASGDSSSAESEVQLAKSSLSISCPERGLVLSWRTSRFRSPGAFMMFKPHYLVHSLHATTGIFLHVTWQKARRKVSSGIATFYWLHAAYFATWTSLGTMLLWFSRDLSDDIGFVDCIFNSVSAITTTGLSSLRVRDFNNFGMVVLMLLMLLGSNVFTSLLPLFLRRFYFYRSDIKSVQNSLANKRERSYSKDINASCTSDMMESAKVCTTSCRPSWHGSDHQPGQIKCPEFRHDVNGIYSYGDDLSTNKIGDGDDLDHSARISYGRVHAVQQKGLEQQSLVALSWIIPLYMFGTLAVGFLALICNNATESKAIRKVFEVEGVNFTFFAMFSAVSAFSNTGLSPLDENFVPFQKKPLVILPLAVLSLAGNTMFPPNMRAIIWVLHWNSGPGVRGRRHSVYEYLLRYPRRCYSHLFPRIHTLWLVITVVVINAVGAIAFCALDWHSVALAIKDWSTGTKIMAALFQSLNTRSAGMNIVALVNLSPPVLVLYVGMMYIAVYPVFLSRQNTRVARSEAMYCESDQYNLGREEVDLVSDNRMSVQYQKLLARDSAKLFFSIFLICILEVGNIRSDPINYSIFSITFEVISAYGNVGLSIGYSCSAVPESAATNCKEVPYSFSGKWSATSKLTLVAVMFLGRHRGLPDDNDSAISCDIYPGQHMHHDAHHHHINFSGSSSTNPTSTSTTTGSENSTSTSSSTAHYLQGSPRCPAV